MNEDRKARLRLRVREEALEDARELLLRAWMLLDRHPGLESLAGPVEEAVDEVEDALRATRDEVGAEDEDRLPERAVEAAAEWGDAP